MKQIQSNRSHCHRLQAVVKHLEQHLDEKVSVEQLSVVACYSVFHFHRIFKAFSGEGVYAMRKRLLLERAVRHLLHGNNSITNIAFDCGYDNQPSFNKAFKNQYGSTPSQVRQSGVAPTPGRNIETVLNQIIGENTMSITLIERQAVEVISARGSGPYDEAAAQAWGKLMPFVYGNRLMQANTLTMGISHDDPSVTGQIKFVMTLVLLCKQICHCPMGYTSKLLPVVTMPCWCTRGLMIN